MVPPIFYPIFTPVASLIFPGSGVGSGVGGEKGLYKTGFLCYDMEVKLHDCV